MKKTLPIVLALFALVLTTRAQAADAKRPNVLFIMADDLNNLLGCYGEETMKTPNLDRLAARGVRFDRAYCQFPLCGPSRNSMLTGLYPNSTGIYGNSQIFRQSIPTHNSMPQAFRLNGYFAARIGKLYHYGVPRSIGTNGHDDPGSWEMEMNPAGVDRLLEEKDIFTLTPGQFGGSLSWYASPRPDPEHTDGLQAADAQWVLERCAKQQDRPFFLALGFFRPHTPYVSPKKYFEMYPKEKMPLVKNVEEDRADIPAAGLASFKKEQESMTDDVKQQAVQAYRASISFMDTQVGKVLDKLDELGLAENTIVVFTSDHGYHMGEHGLWQKMSLFEQSSRVPLIIAGPGVTKGGVAKAPVGLIDLYPTLAERCGVKPPNPIQGQSLVPMLKNPDEMGRGWALTQVTRNAISRTARPSTGNAKAGAGKADAGNAKAAAADELPKAGDAKAAKKAGKAAKAGGKAKAKGGDGESGGGGDSNRFFGYTLRTPKWRYTEWDEGRAGRELYDHENDPQELKNLADDPAVQEEIKKLSATMKEAVKQSFPESGQAPELRDGLWMPDLTNP